MSQCQTGGVIILGGTPIGNLSDASARLRETLESIPVIASEDTRTTIKLLAALGIENRPRLIALHDHPDRTCAEATEIAQSQLADVRAKIAKLTALETELTRLAKACDGDGIAGDCNVLAALADHQLCAADH